MVSTAYLLPSTCAVIVKVDKQTGLIHGLNTALGAPTLLFPTHVSSRLGLT